MNQKNERTYHTRCLITGEGPEKLSLLRTSPTKKCLRAKVQGISR